MYSRTISKKLVAAVAIAVPATLWLGAGPASATRGDGNDLQMQVTTAALTKLVDNDHTITVTLTEDTGTGSVPVVAAHPVPTVVGDGTITANSCALVGTDAAGQCTVDLRSAVPGSATVDFAYSGIANAASPQVQWVDFRVRVTPDGQTKVFGQEHESVVTLKTDTGDGAGFRPVAGASLALSLTDGRILEVLGGTFAKSLQAGTCTTDAAGRCFVTTTSLMPARAVLTASYDVDVEGASLTYKGSAATRWVPVAVDPPAPDTDPEPDGDDQQVESAGGPQVSEASVSLEPVVALPEPAPESMPAPAADVAPVVLNELPRTGAGVAPMASLGFGLALAGLTAVVIGRRRPQAR